MLSENIRCAYQTLEQALDHVTDAGVREAMQKAMSGLECFALGEGAAAEEEIEAALKTYATDDIQIDKGALASRSEDGVWVQGWLFLSGGEGTEISCRKCGSSVVDDYCEDLTCPYSSWPQYVPLEEMYESSTDDLEAKYHIKKRYAGAGHI